MCIRDRTPTGLWLERPVGQEIAGVSPAEARGLLTDVPPSVGDGLAIVADWVGDLLPLERLGRIGTDYYISPGS